MGINTAIHEESWRAKRQDQVRKLVKDFEVSEKAARSMRLRYLGEQLILWTQYEEGEINDVPYNSIDGILEEMNRLTSKPVFTKDTITDDMVARAKSYPIEQLICFTHGKGYAWCHEDKHPSLVWWKEKNQARCFPCDKTFDSIAVVMEMNGIDFKEAVRYLTCL